MPEDSNMAGGTGEPTRPEAEMMDMIRELQDTVDSLRRQLAGQDGAGLPMGDGMPAPPQGEAETDEFEDVDESSFRQADWDGMPPQQTVPSPDWQSHVTPWGDGQVPFPMAANQYPQQQAWPMQDAGWQVPMADPQSRLGGPPPSDYADQSGGQWGGRRWESLSETNIGRYGTGLLASLLVIMGVWIGAQVMWSQMPGVARVGILLATGVVVETIAAVLVRRSEDGSRNGFLTSLSSTGAIVSFLALVIGGMLYGMYGPSLLGLLLMVWFVIQGVVARGMGSRLFYAITYAGGAVALILEATQVAESTNVMTCLAFSLTALVIPAIGFPDRGRNPAVPYASAVFSAIVACTSLMLVEGCMARGVTTGEQVGVTLGWVVENADIAMLVATGFLSGCAVAAGTRGMSDARDTVHIAAKSAFGIVGLVLMLMSANSLDWRFGLVPNGIFCLASLMILLASGEEVLRLPVAALTALSLGRLLDGTQGVMVAAIGTPVSSAVPPLAVACLLPMLPSARRSRGRALSVIVFVALSCMPVLSMGWAENGVAYAAPVTALSLVACLTTFRLAMSWIAMRQDETMTETDVRMLSDPRMQGTWALGMRRMEVSRRFVPLGFAFLASMSLLPLACAKGSLVPPDVSPMLLAILSSLHMALVLGLGGGGRSDARDGNDGATVAAIPQWVPWDEGDVARVVRGWNIAVLFLAYAWAILTHAHVRLGGMANAIGDAAYSLSLVVIPAALISHAVSRRNTWEVVGATVMSHVSFLLVAELWVNGNIGLVASCLSVALAMAFVALGFREHEPDVRMTGLVTAVLFVMKVVLVDMPKAGNTELNMLLLLGTGALCFAMSFAYNRLDRIYGDGRDEDGEERNDDGEVQS